MFWQHLRRRLSLGTGGWTGDIFSFLQNYNKQLSFPICHYPRDPHAVPLGCITTSLTCQNQADSLGKKTKFLVEPSVVVQNTFSYHKITGNYSCNPSWNQFPYAPVSDLTWQPRNSLFVIACVYCYAEISASLVERRQTIYVAISRWTPYDTLSENTTRNFSVVFDSAYKKIVSRSANHEMKYLSFFVLLLSLQDHSKGKYFDETKLLQSAK